MHGDIIIKGSDEEIKHKAEHAKLPLESIEDHIKHPRYIIIDFEIDTSKKLLEDIIKVSDTQFMHVEADIITLSDKSYIYIYIYK